MSVLACFSVKKEIIENKASALKQMKILSHS